MAETNGRYVRVAWLVGVLLTLVFGLGGLWANGVHDSIHDLQQNRVTREEFQVLQRDVHDILNLLLDRSRGVSDGHGGKP